MSETEQSSETLFQKIIRGAIPTDFLYRDDKCVVFKDINPQAPTHLLVVPVKPIVGVSKAQEEDKEVLGHLLLIAKKVADDLKLDKGYRIVINDGEHGGQTVFHLHVHVLGGRQLEWPPG